MKSESVKHITDRNSLSELYSSLFMGRNVFLKSDGINIKVNFIKFNDGRIYLDIPVENYEVKRTAIYTRNLEEVAYSHIIPTGMEEQYYVFETEGSQIFFAPRKEKRIQLEATPGKKTVISHLISNFVIKESFMKNQARIDWLRHEISGKISGKYDYIKVFFLGDKNTDDRMSWIMDDRESIFIHDINSDIKDEGNNTSLSSYMQNIYYNDHELADGNIISEVSVPLLYKMMMPFGYIQINQRSPLTEEDLFMIKRLALAYSESISKDNTLFSPSSDTITISDLSYNGLGMIFKEKSLAKHFREDALVIFTAYLPDNRNASILCRISNITLSDNWYRVGCRIENIDSEGEAHYTKFLQTI